MILRFALRIGDARELFEEVRLGVDADEVQIAPGEGGLHLVALVFAHEAVVDEDAVQLTGDGLGQQRRADGAVHAAGEAEDHVVVAHLLADLPQEHALEIAHVIVALRAADAVEEVVDHRGAVGGVLHLGVELQPVEPPRVVRDRGVRAVRGAGRAAEARRQRAHLVGVAHEADLLLCQPAEEHALGVHGHLRAAIFAHRAGGDGAARGPGHELQPVADAENRDAHVEQRRVAPGRALLIHAVRPAGQDDADRLQLADALERGVAGQNDGIDAALAHAAGDQLFVLASEIEDDYSLIGHEAGLLFLCDKDGLLYSISGDFARLCLRGFRRGRACKKKNNKTKPNVPRAGRMISAPTEDAWQPDLRRKPLDNRQQMCDHMYDKCHRKE